MREHICVGVIKQQTFKFQTVVLGFPLGKSTYSYVIKGSNASISKDVHILKPTFECFSLCLCAIKGTIDLLSRCRHLCLIPCVLPYRFKCKISLHNKEPDYFPSSLGLVTLTCIEDQDHVYMMNNII